MSVSFLPVGRKRRKTNDLVSDERSIEINVMVVPFYRTIDDSSYQYVSPPTNRLIGPVMPRVAWQFGDQEIVIGEVVAMWSSPAGLMANAYINPFGIPASSCTNVAAAIAADHLMAERPVFVSAHIPQDDGRVYKTKGYSITDYEVKKVVMASSNKSATWKNPQATPVTVMKYPHGKNLAWAQVAA